jgi:3-oxoacyl-[acyl-carrier protein] reductase
MIKELDLKGKAALVTGAKQGIGRSVAARLAECGADVAVMDLRLSAEDEVCRDVAALGVKCLPLSGDVSKEESVSAVFDEIAKAFGHLDILVNNAGITRDALSKKMTSEQFRQVLDVNLVGSFLCAQRAMVMMRENGTGGSIVNFSSVVGSSGNVGQANYSASKAGIQGLTKTLALEGAKDRIRVNAVAPGFVLTPMTDVIPEKVRESIIAKIPLGRISYPIDIANSVLFLATDLSSFITGQVLHINGGRYM